MGCITDGNLGSWISFRSLEAVQMTMCVAFSGNVICIVRDLTGMAGIRAWIGVGSVGRENVAGSGTSGGGGGFGLKFNNVICGIVSFVAWCH